MAEQILEMEFDKGYEFFLFARKQIQEDKLFQRWIHGYQTEMSYQEFKNQITKSAKVEAEIPKSDEEAQDMALKALRKVRDILRKD